ncbi:MAG: outer membrane protein transport protein [Bacteroidetes bacterium]|nr:outer membrane protein transport protein [Bacteroidota bacterium]
MACVNKKALTFLAIALMSVSTAFGSGYQLNEHGARAVSMGGAFVARAWDASAIYFNPAGLSYVKGFNVMLGGTLILPSTTFTGPYPDNTEWKMNSISFFPPNAYVSYNFNNGFAAGIGVFTPDGLGTEWPQNWLGRFIITKINLQSFNINPTISYAFGDFISIGVGFDYALGSVLLEKYNPTPFRDASGNPITPFIHMQGDANGTGYNFGIMLKPIKNVSVGFSYRSKIDFKTTNGNATFSQAGVLAGLLPGGAVSTSLPFPENWYAGIAYKGENFSVEADYQHVGWSAYKQLNITFAHQTTLQQNSSIIGDYSDTYVLRVGGEYNLNKMWTLRAGVLYDKNPIPDQYDTPILPDADRLGLNVGVGVNVTNHFAVDASYMFLPFKQRTITTSAYGFDGTYNTTANLIGIDLSYRL